MSLTEVGGPIQSAGSLTSPAMVLDQTQDGRLGNKAGQHDARFNLSVVRQRQVDFCAFKGQPGLHRKFRESQAYTIEDCLKNKTNQTKQKSTKTTKQKQHQNKGGIIISP